MASSSRLVHLLLIPALLLLIMSNKSLRSEAGNVLYNEIGPMYPGGFLKYQDYVLMLQLNCDLVLYDKNETVWSTDTETETPSCSLELDEEGKLVLLDGSGNTLWSSGTTGSKHGRYVLVLQEDRDLVVYGPSLWETNTSLTTPKLPPRTPIDMDPVAENVLIPGRILYPGNSLKNGQWELKLETNCSLVLYEDGDKVIWSNNVTGKIEDGCYLRNNVAGDLVVYDGSGNTLWTTGTSTNLSVLVLQSDRDLVLYGPAIWDSNTSIPATHLLKNATTLPLLPI